MDIRSYLSDLAKDETILFKPNPGNAGDALIACSTFQMFKELGVKYTVFWNSDDFDVSGRIVVYGGGGNLHGVYNGAARETIAKVHERARKLVILPSTITGNEDLLNQLGSNVTIFCREMRSYQYVERIAKQANVMISDDMAFHLNVAKLEDIELPNMAELLFRKIRYKSFRDIRHREIPSPLKALRNAWKFDFHLLNFFPSSKNASGTWLNCFRTDSESALSIVPEDNIDVSEYFSYGAQAELLASYSTLAVFRLLSKFEVIRTDRLHIAIASAILGKIVKFYANGYYKCRAVYEYSMASKFPDVTFFDSRDSTI